VPSINTFTTQLSKTQGRIAHAQHTAIVALGHDQRGWFAALASARLPGMGDHVQVSQRTDLTDIDLIRVGGKLEVRSLPQGATWQATILVDGDRVAVLQGRAAATRPLEDLAANVSDLAGLHTVAVRLELVEVP